MSTPTPAPTPPEPTAPVTNGSLHTELLTWFRRSFGGSLITALIAAGGSTLVAWRAVASEARAQADAGVAPVRLVVDDFGRRLDRTEHDVANLRLEVHEVQADIRALYRYQRTGEPQARLEAPPKHSDAGTDGGTP